MQTIPLPERARIQERMDEWAKLTPRQRGKARLHYQEARELPKIDRQEKWQAYQALPAERKKQLAARAASASHARSRAAEPGSAAWLAGHREPEAKAFDETAQAKSTLVSNPALTPRPRSIAPTLVQARPGATTTPVSKRPSPPLHEQTGMPKIAATPEFVNPSTLLPRLGPQAASVRAAPAQSPPAADR